VVAIELAGAGERAVTEASMSAAKVTAAAMLAVACWSAPAAAEEAAKPAGNVITLKKLILVGRRQVPTATVDIARVEIKVAPAPLAQPFVGRIAAAVEKDPF
jgi:hypothetical protein